MHAGLDEQAEEGFTFETLLRDGEASGVSFSVAGGVSTATIESVQRAGAVVAVAGGAISPPSPPGPQRVFGGDGGFMSVRRPRLQSVLLP